MSGIALTVKCAIVLVLESVRKEMFEYFASLLITLYCQREGLAYIVEELLSD